MGPRPYRGLEERGEVGGGRTLGSSRTPTPTGPCGTGRVPRDILQDHPTPGREDRGEAGRNHSSGTSGTPTPTGRVRLHTPAVIPPGQRRSRRRTEKQNKTAGRLTGCFLRLRAASAHLVEALVQRAAGDAQLFCHLALVSIVFLHELHDHAGLVLFYALHRRSGV